MLSTRTVCKYHDLNIHICMKVIIYLKCMHCVSLQLFFYPAVKVMPLVKLMHLNLLCYNVSKVKNLLNIFFSLYKEHTNFCTWLLSLYYISLCTKTFDTYERLILSSLTPRYSQSMFITFATP